MSSICVLSKIQSITYLYHSTHFWLHYSNYSLFHHSAKLKWSLLFDTPQVFDFLKVDSDAALLHSWYNW